MDTVLPGWGAGFVAMAVLFFVFTTLVTYYYMAETNVTYINRKVHRPWLILLLRLVTLAAVTFGVFRTTAMAWALGDIGVGLMAWLNLVAIVILHKPALVALRDYERQKRAGVVDYDFDPQALGIRNAHYWERRDAGLEPDLPEPGRGGAAGGDGR
jgi:AGCS family alanine or glycine:cation symporter